jgi:hypothetical protein
MNKIIAAFFMALAVMLSPQMDMKAYSFAAACVTGGHELEPACLPVVGRMVRDQKATCHCPPATDDYCPNTIDDWENWTKSPNSVISICCDKPKKECRFTEIQQLACGQPTSIKRNAAKNIKYCVNHVVSTNDTTLESSVRFQTLTNEIEAIDARIIKIQGDILDLSDAANAPGGNMVGNMAQAETLIKQIQKIIADEIEPKRAILARDFSGQSKKIEINCFNESTQSYCTQTTSPACQTSGECSKGRGQVTDQAAYEALMKDKCKKIEWFDCVAEGTTITMADGSKRKIQEVRVGEYVRGYNSNNKVTGMTMEESTPNSLFTLNKDDLHITGGHPILTVAGWKAIHPEDVNAEEKLLKQITKLVEGDEIIIADEATIKVKSISAYIGPKVPTFNLAVNGDYTYIANGIVIRAFKNSTQY